MGIGAESCRRNARIDRKGAFSAAADCAEFAKKAEIANILFNIMNEISGNITTGSGNCK